MLVSISAGAFPGVENTLERSDEGRSTPVPSDSLMDAPFNVDGNLLATKLKTKIKEKENSLR